VAGRKGLNQGIADTQFPKTLDFSRIFDVDIWYDLLGSRAPAEDNNRRAEFVNTHNQLQFQEDMKYPERGIMVVGFPQAQVAQYFLNHLDILDKADDFHPALDTFISRTAWGKSIICCLPQSSLSRLVSRDIL
jgi:hypothetical protein